MIEVPTSAELRDGLRCRLDEAESHLALIVQEYRRFKCVVPGETAVGEFHRKAEALSFLGRRIESADEWLKGG